MKKLLSVLAATICLLFFQTLSASEYTTPQTDADFDFLYEVEPDSNRLPANEIDSEKDRSKDDSYDEPLEELEVLEV